jgi:hypothetical protein
MVKEIHLPIVWDERYEKIGVSPHELYMRQQGLCYLIKEVDAQGNTRIYCTDGDEKAETNKMLNPSFECVKCITSFTLKVLEDGKEK